MSDEPATLVLEYLLRMDVKLDRRIDRVETRLDRIERRLDLVDQPH